MTVANQYRATELNLLMREVSHREVECQDFLQYAHALLAPPMSRVVQIVRERGRLHMRYSARLRNIEWKDDVLVAEAVAFLQGIWEAGSSAIIKHTLQAGQGVVCNNVLHGRTGFEDIDGQTRLLFRGRYRESTTAF